MLQSKNIKRNWIGAFRTRSSGSRPSRVGALGRAGLLAVFGLVTSISIGVTSSSPTHALSCTDGSISCIAVQFGSPVGDRTVNPSSNIYSATQFYLPVSINIGHNAGYAVDYSIKVFGSGSSLTDENNPGLFIPSVLQNTSYNDLGKDGSQWGIRWNFGDKVEDSYSDYHPVPSSIDDPTSIVVSDGTMDKTTTSLSKNLTLGFAVAVDGNQASGSYTNTITVAVVASPKDARTLFDISTMQEMESSICERTTTPAATAISTGADINVTASGESYTTAIDTDGSKQGNTAYVPQRELTDIRDGKKYTIRKLADGNCWMVSNLEFDLVPTSDRNIANGTTNTSAYSTTGEDKLTGSQIVLTNKDTDLNSMREWTPAIAKEIYGEAGTVYTTQRNAGAGDGVESAPSVTTPTIWRSNGTDGLRSFSSAAGYPNALYSTRSTTGTGFGTANIGEPWQKFGNLYNWTTATLGSGTMVTEVDENAIDSICPQGWRLPYNVGDGSFSSLLKTYGLPETGASNVATEANQLANFPLNFMRTGLYSWDSKLYARITDGNWWSATGNSENRARLLRTYAAIIYTQGNSPRGAGFGVRCVAR